MSTCTMSWMESARALGHLMRRFPSDKATGGGAGHNYQHMYHRYLAPLVRRKCRGESDEQRTLRIFEIGLGCGVSWGAAGGSVAIWKALPPPRVRLELHVMEYDAACARRWVSAQATGSAVMAVDWRPGPDRPRLDVVIHTGDQNSTTDLTRVYVESGGRPFDAVIDDGSHLNAHQIRTLEHALAHSPQWVAQPGVYIVEDIQSACRTWRANEGDRQRSRYVDGTPGCMLTRSGQPTIYSRLVEWQILLLGAGAKAARLPFPGVHHIAIFEQAAALEVTEGEETAHQTLTTLYRTVPVHCTRITVAAAAAAHRSPPTSARRGGGAGTLARQAFEATAGGGATAAHVRHKVTRPPGALPWASKRGAAGAAIVMWPLRAAWRTERAAARCIYYSSMQWHRGQDDGRYAIELALSTLLRNKPAQACLG
eukprot:CAMPEP_0119356196 /NCGR_PEP_ID=MMETSP1334-20130426/4860_1 /TAXON_ID=127549 /ORGANISM="Calcidiscus leptoporus, Strain RCC1130" /LENGTH=424 /DNA_ID=CAMNT_0007370183 /DNA_START=10 /DNA_END=1286 /DNA_ORIENTATION=+